ncbi:MAG: ATP-binding domain-containing protein [Gaiellaceae bacterium]
MAHPDLPLEQAYVDRAYAALDEMRDVVSRAANATDQEVAALALEAWSARRLVTYEDAERGLLFGRLDFDDVGRPLYVGRRWVQDDEQRQLVVNWQAPAARPFYTATPVDPQRVNLRRRFRTEGRRLTDIADESLDGSTLDGARVGDFLLEELDRSRETRMRDIVATIQADQYRLITHAPDRPLVIQGGPGTGKTAVGLHRASWLLYTHRDTLARSRVLVVGPNRLFMEYVSHVLPALGEHAVEQRAVFELVDGPEPTLTDAPDVARLKADPRLAEVLARAVELRLESEPEEIYLRLEGEYVRVRAREIAALLRETREVEGTNAIARERFRMALVRRFYSAYSETLGGSAMRDGEEIEKALKANGYLARILERAWPSLVPEKLVRALFAQPAFLAEASDGILEDEEQVLLRHGMERRRRGPARRSQRARRNSAAQLRPCDRRRGAGSDSDAGADDRPARTRGRADPTRRRRAGDRRRCLSKLDEVMPHLPRAEDAEIEELRHAYRVPREIMDVALPLLATIAPDVAPPLSYRRGANEPLVRRVPVEELLREAYREAARLAREDGLLALIVPDELIEPALADETAYEGVPLLTARDAKGLEFDHVIVVEPALLAEREQGLRELYVALTRPTKTLVIVHARELPRELRYAE